MVNKVKEKLFAMWCALKVRIDRRERKHFYKEREVYWCHFGVNIGHEQDGKGEKSSRPALVIKGLSKETCFVVPLTTATHAHTYRIPVGVIGGKKTLAIISQMRVVDVKRFTDRIGIVDKEVFAKIRKAVKDMF